MTHFILLLSKCMLLSGSVDADLHGANMRHFNLSGFALRDTNLRDTDLRSVNFTNADISGSDMKGANLDYSAWPLWCGSFDVTVDKRIFAQLCYHLCRLKIDDIDCNWAQEALSDIANLSHVVKHHGCPPIQTENPWNIQGNYGDNNDKT